MKETAFRSLIIAALALSQVLGACAGNSPGPDAKVDVSTLSEGFRLTLSQAVKPPVHLTFLDDQLLIVSSVDGIGSPLRDSRANKSSQPLHLTLDFFTREPKALHYGGNLRFNVSSSTEGVEGLSDGRFVVNSESDVLLYSKDRALLRRAPVEDICGLDKPFSSDSMWSTSVHVGSYKAGLLNVSRQQFVKGQDISDNGGNLACWFSLDDLRPIAKMTGQSWFGATSAGDMEYFAGPEGYTTSFSARGRQLVIPPADCQSGSQYGDWRVSSLIHFEGSIAVVCKEALQVNDRGKIFKVKLPRNGNKLPTLRSSAWSAPVVAVVAGTIRVPLAQGSFRVNSRIEVVNFMTGGTRFFSTDESEVGPLYTGGLLEIALSPSGRTLAVLSGSILSVYDTEIAQ